MAFAAKSKTPSDAQPTDAGSATRQRILEAATAEFSAKGLAGARVDTIARRARINKRMLYYYFGDKAELYRQVLMVQIRRRGQMIESMPDDPAEALVSSYEAIGADIDWARMLEWEALGPWHSHLIAGDERKALFTKGVGRLDRFLAGRSLPPGVDPAQLMISLIALTAFPIAFPQMIFLMTGLMPTDPEFIRKRLDFLRWFGGELRKSLKPPDSEARQRPVTARRRAPAWKKPR